MKPENKDTIEYKARIFKDNAVIPQIEEQLRVLVQVILGDKRTLKIEHYKNLKYSNGETKLFDVYPSCKQHLKEYCYCKPTKYRGYIPELGYYFYGDSYIDIYCDLIKRFIGEPRVIIPFSY